MSCCQSYKHSLSCADCVRVNVYIHSLYVLIVYG